MSILQQHHSSLSTLLLVGGVFLGGVVTGIGWLGSTLPVECAVIGGEAIGPACSTLQTFSHLSTQLLVGSAACMLGAMLLEAYYSRSGIFSSFEVASCNQQDVEAEQ